MKQEKKQAFLSGNAAIARGAWEAGVRFAAAYPGTPSTEIMEYCGTYDEIDAQWAVNEKTAMETAIGASYGGARALCAQKHVGLNVAADPFFSFSYTGVNAGLVLVTADDPGMHSSQNEQDNRYYAMMAKVPLFEPSNSQEAKEMTIAAIKMSEEFDTPVMLRTTTRISHSEGIVTLSSREDAPQKEFVRDQSKYCLLPQNARKAHLRVEERLQKLSQLASESKWNRIERGDEDIGIITSGISYEYAKEILPKASFLKLGLTFPFSAKLIKEFADSVKTLIVIEENEPFIETFVKSLGINCIGKDLIPLCGELSPDIIHQSLKQYVQKDFPQSIQANFENLPVRPPVLCPGCPHRGVFYTLRKNNCTVTGDIGCYSLGSLPPHNAMHTTVCMGASITNALGIEKAMKDKIHGKLVAVLGESTFIHSGITGLIDTVYNQGRHVTMVLDNSITAMTGHQPNPANGVTLKGNKTKKLDLKAVAEACGISKVTKVDPFDLDYLDKVLKESLKAEEPSVIITERPCFLLKGYKPPANVVSINREKCVKCGMCWKLGCPAIEISTEDGKTVINPDLCVHCGLCADVCKPGAITIVREEAKQ